MKVDQFRTLSGGQLLTTSESYIGVRRYALRATVRVSVTYTLCVQVTIEMNIDMILPSQMLCATVDELQLGTRLFV